MRQSAIIILVTLAVSMVSARPSEGREYHVSPRGKDSQDGTRARPLRTVSAAAGVARPGDVVTVHAGVYRERITPPRGGESDQKRIAYRAAPGERVVIKGSEAIKGWQKVENATWKVTIPNRFFGDFNPYRDLIHGDWFDPKGRDHHTGAVYLNGHWLTEAASVRDVLKPIAKRPLWFGQVDETNTTIWAQFEDVNPNEAEVEINVRQTVLYPDEPGIDYITVRGFTMMHAATPWAPPTAEQIGLIGTHWSKGWIIENNDIRYATCACVTLGKYGDRWDNTSEDTAEGYVETIKRALDEGWSKELIGGHLVRGNRISHCEQAGLVGSLGAAFSTITANVVHDIHVRRLFGGAEMAGIKSHAAIDSEISGNRIYRTPLGIWLDWMAQGTRVTRNLLHDNDTQLFVEVNHGPFLVDNNLFLSSTALSDMSEGGAYVHNLFAGEIVHRPEPSRETPFHRPHSTDVAGLRNIAGGDDRFFNNIFVGGTGLAPYETAARPVQMAGNVFLQGARPAKQEQHALVQPSFEPAIELVERQDGVYVQISLDKMWAETGLRQLITTERLGKATIPDLPYEQPDGSPYRIDTDWFGKTRSRASPFPGPFELPEGGRRLLKVSERLGSN
ncbi:MAG: right-handed parallel beta-helix repeat-containing protein [Vicinamibacteraceae bacterium]